VVGEFPRRTLLLGAGWPGCCSTARRTAFLPWCSARARICSSNDSGSARRRHQDRPQALPARDRRDGRPGAKAGFPPRVWPCRGRHGLRGPGTYHRHPRHTGRAGLHERREPAAGHRGCNRGSQNDGSTRQHAERWARRVRLLPIVIVGSRRNPCVITDATLTLVPGERNAIAAEMLEILRERRRKFPLTLPNCRLGVQERSSKLGLPGPDGEDHRERRPQRYLCGDAVVSERHANFHRQ